MHTGTHTQTHALSTSYQVARQASLFRELEPMRIKSLPIGPGRYSRHTPAKPHTQLACVHDLTCPNIDATISPKRGIDKSKYEVLISPNLRCHDKSKNTSDDKSKFDKKIITAAAISHVLICPNQAAIILPRGDKSPSHLADQTLAGI